MRLRGSRARAVMVALSAILVPAALTLMIGTRDKLKTSHLLRDSVVRYDKDPQQLRSNYGPKTGVDVDAHTSQAILRLQLVEKLRPGKGTTGFLEVDVAMGDWSHAYNVAGGNEPKLEESVLKAFFGRHRGEKLHGYDLGLPTPYRATARALDAECVCENHAHALRVSESTGRHNSKHAAMLASTIAGCMAQDIYAKELGTATGWKRGNDWLRKGHGGCGKLPGTGEEEEEEVARRKRTCADRVTPLYGPDGAYEHLRAGWFDKFSKECPWEGTTSDGRILSLRV